MADKIPSIAELQREISEFIKNKYGKNVAIPEPQIQEPPAGDEATAQKKARIQFNLKPEELEAYLKQFVINQDAAIEVLATKICTHFNRMNFEQNSENVPEIIGNVKSNVVMLGPTGVGKTYLIKLIANRVGVPFVKGDATKFSETGYVGGDVEDLIRDLLREAQGDIELAEYGIVYLDEIDKIAGARNTIGPDVSRTGVQRNLLKLMEESEVEIRPPHDLASQMEAVMEAQRAGKVVRKKINTKNILFVVSGAFVGLEEIIKKRLHQQAIGFKHEQRQAPSENGDYLRLTKAEDLIEYGFESEFVGRLPVVVHLNTLDVAALYQILKNPSSSVVLSKKRDFMAYGIELEFEDAAFSVLAEMAYAERTGARGILSALEKTLIKYEKKLPSTQIKKFMVTQAVVQNPVAELNRLLWQESRHQFQHDFQFKTGIILNFTPKAIALIQQQAQQEQKDFQQKCQEIFQNYEYGLKLINVSEFVIDESILEDPQGKLEMLIKRTYQPVA